MVFFVWNAFNPGVLISRYVEPMGTTTLWGCLFCIRAPALDCIGVIRAGDPQRRTAQRVLLRCGKKRRVFKLPELLEKVYTIANHEGGGILRPGNPSAASAAAVVPSHSDSLRSQVAPENGGTLISALRPSLNLTSPTNLNHSIQGGGLLHNLHRPPHFGDRVRAVSADRHAAHIALSHLGSPYKLLQTSASIERRAHYLAGESSLVLSPALCPLPSALCPVSYMPYMPYMSYIVHRMTYNL
jgi:hypothetical protein